ncbi:MAG: hypothetical protein V4755_10010 [Curtobacterium sp.]
MDGRVRPLPRWAEVGSVVVAAVAIALAVVLRLLPAGGALDTARFAFLLAGLAAMIAALVVGLTAMGRGRYGVTLPQGARALDRRTRRRIGAAAAGRIEPPAGTEDLVQVTARRIVAQTRISVLVCTGMIVLEASNGSGDEPWRWLFILAAVMFTVALVMTLRQYRGAMRVLGRPRGVPAVPADEAR